MFDFCRRILNFCRLMFFKKVKEGILKSEYHLGQISMGQKVICQRSFMTALILTKSPNNFSSKLKSSMFAPSLFAFKGS